MDSLLGSRKVERWRREVATKMHFISTAARPPRPPRGHSACCRRDQCCHAGRQLLSTCSYAAAAAGSLLDQQLMGPSPLGLAGLPSGARSPMAVGSVHHCRCLPWIGAWTGKGLEGGPAAGPAACRPAASPANSRRTSSVLVQPPRQSVSRRDGRPPHGPGQGSPAGPPAALPALRRLLAHRGGRAVQRGAQEVDSAEAAAR